MIGFIKIGELEMKKLKREDVKRCKEFLIKVRRECFAVSTIDPKAKGILTNCIAIVSEELERQHPANE